MTLDAIDRRIINALQGGFPIAERPFAVVADELLIHEDELLARIDRMLDLGVLSRFGPMFDTERLGGAVTLAALAVPEERFETVTELVNAHHEVAHNYRREHALNMWFVVAAERPGRVAEVLGEIEVETGLEVHDLPKQDEYFLEARFTA
jgi:siroheme decarboxylase